MWLPGCDSIMTRYYNRIEMKMRKNVKRSSLQMIRGICFAGILILTACSESAAPEPTQTVEVQKTQPQEESPTQAPAETATTTSIITEQGYPAPPQNQGGAQATPEGGYPAPEDQLPTPEDQTGGYPSPDESYPPPLKTALQATVPSTVNLASGELQLVEFFDISIQHISGVVH